jgi:hypothetical protein
MPLVQRRLEKPWFAASLAEFPLPLALAAPVESEEGTLSLTPVAKLASDSDGLGAICGPDSLATPAQFRWCTTSWTA